MTNPFLNFLKKVQQDLKPIEAAALQETEQVGLAALQALIDGLVLKLVPAGSTQPTTDTAA